MFKQGGGKKIVKHPCVVIKSEAAIQELRNRRVSKPREKTTLRLHQAHGTFGGAAISKNENAEISVKNTDKFDGDEKERPKSYFRCSQSNITKRNFSSSTVPVNWKSKIEEFYKPEGKKYRSRHGPKDIDMNDPKLKEKLYKWQRRDTKSGGLSWSSRVRLDGNRIRLGSDRFSRPRSDRIYNCSEDT